MLYTLVEADERAAPESIRALNLFPAYTVTVRQLDTKSYGVMVFKECPSHPFSSLMGEGSSSLKDQSHCWNLMKNLKGNPV